MQKISSKPRICLINIIEKSSRLVLPYKDPLVLLVLAKPRVQGLTPRLNDVLVNIVLLL